MIENVLPPAEVHAEALAELLKSRTVQIQQALQAMTKSEKSKAMWAGIRTHHHFDRSQVIEWAQQRLVDYEVMRLRQVSAGDDDRYPVPAERN